MTSKAFKIGGRGPSNYNHNEHGTEHDHQIQRTLSNATAAAAAHPITYLHVDDGTDNLGDHTTLDGSRAGILLRCNTHQRQVRLRFAHQSPSLQVAQLTSLRDELAKLRESSDHFCFCTIHTSSHTCQKLILAQSIRRNAKKISSHRTRPQHIVLDAIHAAPHRSHIAQDGKGGLPNQLTSV